MSFPCLNPWMASHPSWNKIQTSFYSMHDSRFCGLCLSLWPYPLLLSLVHEGLAFFLFDRFRFAFCSIGGESGVSSHNKAHCCISDRFIYKLWDGKINKDKAFYRWQFMFPKRCHWIWLERSPTFFYLTGCFLGYPTTLVCCLASELDEISFRKQSLLFLLLLLLFFNW